MQKTKVIVNGSGGSGKDTFAAFCAARLNGFGLKSDVCSSVDKVKAAAVLLGWDGEKDDRGRSFLHELKMLSTKTFDGPMRSMDDFLAETDASVVFFMIREPQ